MHNHVIRSLRNGHKMMEHVLTLIRLHLDMLGPQPDADQFKFLQNAIAYMHLYPGLIHHPAEELMFERLVSRAPHTQAMCGRLEEQHAMFKMMESSMLERLREAQMQQADVLACIREVGGAYCLTHAEHIAAEEGEVLPEAMNWLAPEDWSEIGEKSLFHIDPLSNPRILADYDNLYDYLMEEGINFTRH